MKARNIVEKARRQVSESLGCDADEVIFTSGGTESNNIAIQGYLKFAKKKHIITSKIEHHAVLNVLKNFQKNGYEVRWIDVDKYGVVKVDEVIRALKDDTAFISIMMANNEVGTVQPIKEIVKRVKEYSQKIIIHTDAVQAFGKVHFNVKDIGVDMLSISAHKINGPKGVGALYIRKGLKIKKLFFGGHHERGLRAGTENVAGIAGFGVASKEAIGNLKENNIKLWKLRDRLQKGIEENIKNIKINSPSVSSSSLSNTLNISFRNVEGESIIMMLDMEGIAVSTGSACTSGTLEPSHVLLAMGVDAATSQGSIRFSLSKYNTSEEIDYVIEKLPPIIERLRKMSPLEKETR